MFFWLISTEIIEFMKLALLILDSKLKGRCTFYSLKYSKSPLNPLKFVLVYLLFFFPLKGRGGGGDPHLISSLILVNSGITLKEIMYNTKYLFSVLGHCTIHEVVSLLTLQHNFKPTNSE
jgi:hypothetical protein